MKIRYGNNIEAYVRFVRLNTNLIQLEALTGSFIENLTGFVALSSNNVIIGRYLDYKYRYDVNFPTQNGIVLTNIPNFTDPEPVIPDPVVEEPVVTELATEIEETTTTE